MRRIIRENDFKFWEKLKKNSELKYSDLSATDDGKEYKEKQYDKLADAVRASLDMDAIYMILEQGLTE